MTPRLFPQKILDAKVLKTSSTPHIAVVIIKYRKEKHTCTKSFPSPVFDTGTPAKLNTCRAACKYIIRNFMDEFKQLDNDDTLMSDNGSDGNQYYDKDLNANNMIDQPHIESIPGGEPSIIKDGLSNSDKDITRTHYSTINWDDVNLLSPLLDIPTEDRNIQYDVDLANEVFNISEDCFHKAEGSPIFTKRLKRN